MTCSITLTDKNLKFENVGPLLTADELGEFLGLTASQLSHFRHQHGIHRVRGTNKYSTAEALEAIVGISGQTATQTDDPGLAALQAI